MKPRKRPRPQKTSKAKVWFKRIRNTIIISIVAIVYGFVMLHYGQKKFYEWDSSKKLNYLTKKPIDYDPYYSPEGSLTKPIRDKKLNGLLPFDGWQETAQHPETKETLYDVYMNVSEIGSRVNNGLSSNAYRHLIVAGDSQIFGMGVGDDQVATNLINYKYSSFNTYNMGHAAWSPSSTYAFFDPAVGVDLKSYVREEQGVMVYVMFPYLTYRDNAFPNALAFTSGFLTNYERVGNDLVLRGNFKQTSSYWLNMKKAAAFYDKVDFVENVIMPLPYLFSKKRMMKEAFAHSAYLLSGMRYNYQNLFPNSFFYVAVCDNTNDDPEKLLVGELQKTGLEVVDFTDQQVCNSLMPFSYVEHHLNPEGHQELMRLIDERIIGINREQLGF